MPEPIKTGLGDADRMTQEDLDKELGTMTGKERAYKAKILGEDWGFTVGEEAGAKKTVAGQAEALEVLEEAAAKNLETARELSKEEAASDAKFAFDLAQGAITVARDEGFAAGVASVDVISLEGSRAELEEAHTLALEARYQVGKADGIASVDVPDASEGKPDSDSNDSDTSEYDRGVAAGRAQAAAGEEAEEEMVECPACNGTGKMIGWGDQCKKCYGATKVKASSLIEEVEVDG